MTDSRKYSIKKDDNILVFTTSSFKAEKSSVLHKGIYNYEFTSILFASVVCGIVYIVMAVKYRISFASLLIIGVVFIAVSVLFRKFIFRERTLRVVIDRAKKIVTIYSPGIISYRPEKLSFEEIVSVEVGSKSIIPENQDAVNFVQKISLQHGSEVPGLGEEEEFVTLVLKVKGGTERLIYAGKIEGKVEGEPELPLNEIKNFLATDLPTGRQAHTDFLK